PSHDLLLVPILVATKAKSSPIEIITTSHNDYLVNPIKTNAMQLQKTIEEVLNFFNSEEFVNCEEYVKGSYSPTPTIIEAAICLYNNHKVEEITRSDADAINLKITTQYISEIIDYAKENCKK